MSPAALYSWSGYEPYDNADGHAESAFDRMLQPNTLLPCQTAPQASGKRPERALAMAVLQQALVDYQVWTTKPRLRPVHELGLIDLMAWFASDDIAPHSFSFAWLCEVLNLAPSDVRRWMAEQDLSGVTRLHRKCMYRPMKMKLRGAA